MKYTFSCPIEGCTWSQTVEVENQEEALDKLSAAAKEHVVTVHTDLNKTDKEIRADVAMGMKEGEGEVSAPVTPKV